MGGGGRGGGVGGGEGGGRGGRENEEEKWRTASVAFSVGRISP